MHRDRCLSIFSDKMRTPAQFGQFLPLSRWPPIPLSALKMEGHRWGERSKTTLCNTAGITTRLMKLSIEVNKFTSNSLQFINRQMFKTQYYKHHLFLAFSRQNAPLPWQQTKIASGSSSYFDEYLKGYPCAKFGAFATIFFSQIRWTIRCTLEN